MGLYRKKTQECVEAVQWTQTIEAITQLHELTNSEAVEVFVVDGKISGCSVTIPSVGAVYLDESDWLIKRPGGDYRGMDSTNFQDLWEPVE